jgi:hypothetical protein
LERKAFKVSSIDFLLHTHKDSSNLPVVLEWSRLDLPIVFNECGFKVGAEIGVEKGLFSKAILGANPDMLLHCIDPLVPYKGYREHVSKKRMDGFYRDVHTRLAGYNFIFHREFSVDAVKDFEDGSLDFVYIDGNHDFLNTTLDIHHWSRKVRSGGIVAGHDYTSFVKEFNRCDVKQVVNAWTKSFNIRPWFITSEKTPSWFWVNP